MISDLCEHLLDFSPESELVFTKAKGFKAQPDPLAGYGQWYSMPGNSNGEIDRFLDQVNPACIAWLDAAIHPKLFATLKRRDIALHIIDSGGLLENRRNRGLLSRFARSSFRDATTITIGDPETMRMLRSERVPPQRIYFRGILERGSVALDVDEVELERFSEAIRARPIWLAAHVNEQELPAVIDAHVQALRRAHRLMLILAPTDVGHGEAIAKALTDRGMEFRRRSAGEIPDEDTQVYLADVEDELGLWYRLSPIAFLGHTLRGQSTSGPDPFHAAALGSALIHGAAHHHHPSAFARLRRADATIEIGSAGELAQAVDALLSADKSAELAHRAWTVSTADSDMYAHIAALMTPSPGRDAGSP